MKSLTFFLGFILFLEESTFCQFPYATPNIVKGKVICSFTRTSQTFEKNKVVSKSTSTEEFATPVLINFAETSESLPSYRRRVESLNRTPLILVANNYSRTYNKDERYTGADKVPRFPTTIHQKHETWSIDPCSTGDETLMQDRIYSAFGTSSEPSLNMSLEGFAGDKGSYIVRLNIGGMFHTIKGIMVTGKSRQLDDNEEDPKKKCKWKDFTGDGIGLNPPGITSILVGRTDLPKEYKGANGHFTYTDDRFKEEGTVSTQIYDFLKLDTALVFKYLRDKPRFMQFQMTGRLSGASKEYEDKTGNGTYSSDIRSRTESTEICALTLIIGELENQLILSTTKEDDYHDWMPFRKDEDGYMPLQVKAEIKSEDPEPKDTIHFYLKDVSHYPGSCTNYPLWDKNTKPDGTADIRFAREQSDPNIEYIDTFHVKTNKKVENATVDIECYDYGGFAKLTARTAIKNVKGYNKYNNTDTLKIPEDENKNHIADKWEVDIGIFRKDLKEKDDSDESPEDQKDTGDGFTLFEEYRGFYADRDFCKENKNIVRKGKFIRTDPEWKDAFIYDATHEIFEKLYAPSNPADLNWHLVEDDQMKHNDAGAINTWLISAPRDQNGVILEHILNQFCKQLIDNDHRWMNYNTPPGFRLDKHFGLFLLYSDHLSGSETVGQENAGGGKYPGHYKNVHFIEMQRYAPYEQSVINRGPKRVFCSNSQCTFQFLLDPNATNNPPVCPKCGSQLLQKPYYDMSQIKQIAWLTYEGGVIHEIGHGLGLKHHETGVSKWKDPKGVEHAIKPVGIILPSYLLEDDMKAAWASMWELGVTSCAMKYNFKRLEEFSSGSIFTKTNRYCHKNETYVDDYKNVQKADNCYGMISVK